MDVLQDRPTMNGLEGFDTDAPTSALLNAEIPPSVVLKDIVPTTEPDHDICFPIEEAQTEELSTSKDTASSSESGGSKKAAEKSSQRHSCDSKKVTRAILDKATLSNLDLDNKRLDNEIINQELVREKLNLEIQCLKYKYVMLKMKCESEFNVILGEE